jgi:hypothetical protein
MMLTKRKTYINNISDVKYWIKVSDLKLKRTGRMDNHVRICESGLSWQDRIGWLKRISEYKGSRQETLEYYTVLYNCKNKAEVKMKEKGDKVRGDKNPWSAHGGKYSPFSKGSTNYSEAAIQKANENRTYDTRLEYYTNKGMSDEDAAAALSARQTTFSLEKCIDKLGEIKGRERWNERQAKWMKSIDSLPEEEKLRINSLKASSAGATSKAERELFDILEQSLPELGKSLSLSRENKSRYYSYDMFYKNKIIEYNGDFWHANPKIYDVTFVNRVSKKTASEIWEKEFDKGVVAKQNGYEVFTIWETDYKKDKQKCIKECLEFLQNEK